VRRRLRRKHPRASQISCSSEYHPRAKRGLGLIDASCLDARYPDGSPLTPSQRRAHVTLLIQAGADTTGTALGSILRFLVTDPAAFARARAEIDLAAENGLLSQPIQFEETRKHLPFFIACIKEGLRLNPPGGF
jgi:cytochrome P450